MNITRTSPQLSKEYCAARRWATEHIGELHQRYEGQWVAISDGRIVAAGLNPRRVEAEALRKTGRLRRDLYIRFVESSTAIYEQSFAPL